MNKKISAKKQGKKVLSAKPDAEIEMEHLPNAAPLPKSTTGTAQADHKVNADGELVELLKKAEESGVSRKRAEEFACMEFILGATPEDANLFSLRQALKLKDVSVADAVIRRLGDRLLCVETNEGVVQLQVLSVEKLDINYFLNLNPYEHKYLQSFISIYRYYTYFLSTYTDGMRKRIVDILEGIKNEKKLKAAFGAVNAIAQNDPPSDHQVSLMAEIPSMNDDQVKLMSLLAEHFRYADWQPSKLYEGVVKSGKIADFISRVYSERLQSGSFTRTDLKGYDRKASKALENQIYKDGIDSISHLNMPIPQDYHDQMSKEGWIYEAEKICKILETIRKTRSSPA